MENKNDNPEDDHGDFLTLSLSCGSKRTKRSPSPPPPPSRPLPLSLPPRSPSSEKSIPTHPTTFPLRQQISSYSHSNFSPSMQTLYYQTPPSQMPLQLPPNHPLYFLSPVPEPPPPPSITTHLTIPDPPSRPVRSRRNASHDPREDRAKTIPPPYPWATNRPAIVHKLSYLLQRQILTITGMVRCAKCERDYEMGFDLEDKLAQVWSFIARNKCEMHDRAPNVWMTPVLLTCKYCSRESARPIISENKETINWLFLFLGQLLGCCTLEQLKYFCGCTQNHRTGAKDRVLYLTYISICKQLDPDGPFDSW